MKVNEYTYRELTSKNKIGSLVYEKDLKYDLSDEKVNVLFSVEDGSVNDVKIEEEFDKYYKKVIYLTSKSKDNTSFILFGNEKDIQYYENHRDCKDFLVNDIKLLNESNKILLARNGQNQELLSDLVSDRSNTIPTNDVVVIIRQLENFDIPSFDMLLTVSRSRKIYYIIEIEDAQKFNNKYTPEVLEIIKAHSKLFYVVGEEGKLEIKY